MEPKKQACEKKQNRTKKEKNVKKERNLQNILVGKKNKNKNRQDQPKTHYGLIFEKARLE